MSERSFDDLFVAQERLERALQRMSALIDSICNGERQGGDLPDDDEHLDQMEANK